jgi:hypothetical protein
LELDVLGSLRTGAGLLYFLIIIPLLKLGLCINFLSGSRFFLFIEIQAQASMAKLDKFTVETVFTRSSESEVSALFSSLEGKGCVSASL